MTKPWQQSEVKVILPIAEAREMWRRAELFDVDRGGRYDARGGCILIWSASFPGDHERAEPQGEAYIRWHTPDDRHATWVKFGWDTEEGGSEEMVWQALELLAGRALR